MTKGGGESERPDTDKRHLINHQNELHTRAHTRTHPPLLSWADGRDIIRHTEV